MCRNWRRLKPGRDIQRIIEAAEFLVFSLAKADCAGGKNKALRYLTVLMLVRCIDILVKPLVIMDEG